MNVNLYLLLFVGNWIYLILVLIGFLCLFVPGVYLLVCWIWWQQHLFFNYNSDPNASFFNKVWGSFKASRELVLRDWWGVFIFAVCCFFANLVAGFTIVLGLIAVPVFSFAYTESYFMSQEAKPVQQADPEAQVPKPEAAPESKPEEAPESKAEESKPAEDQAQ